MLNIKENANLTESRNVFFKLSFWITKTQIRLDLLPVHFFSKSDTFNHN